MDKGKYVIDLPQEQATSNVLPQSSGKGKQIYGYTVGTAVGL